VYNAVLRRFPADIYQTLSDGENLFSTTIMVLVSAVQKIACSMNIPNDTLLYRGLGGLMEIPDSFFRPDEKGCTGFVEWGFISTTANKSVAIKYSGVEEGRPHAIVLEIRTGAVDKGACIQQLSQYPQVILLLKTVKCQRP
jgi:hypothetical protein